MELSNEQQIVFDKYIEGNNIFITGPGGTGKSELIRMINSDAVKKGKSISICAMTGCASVLLNCNARTVHSWSGIGIGNGTIDEIIKKIKSNRYAKKAWIETEILVVDEVSMMSLKIFDVLNKIGKVIRVNERAFGGIQVIFSGDFYQLPPVGKKEVDACRFCFESEEWNNVFDKQIQLIKIYRQTDETYASILNQIREGKIKKRSHEMLTERVGINKEKESELIITKMYPTKHMVESVNNSSMSMLEGEEREYALKNSKNLEMSKNDRVKRGEYSDTDIMTELDYMASNILCEKSIKLKVGAQVMCVVNIQSDNGLLEVCNGSQGKITRFCEITGCPIVKFNNGKEMTMTMNTWKSERIPGVGIKQVPLILAWAITIHKSQGATMDAAEIDIGSDIFECGQTYVALSRIKSILGLYLTSYDVSKIKINKKVKEFYEKLVTY